MDCRNLVNVNDWWSPNTLCGMWEPCNRVNMYDMVWMWEPCSCQWLLWSPYLMWMWEPCKSQWLMVSNMLCWKWEPCNYQWLMVPWTYMECGDLAMGSSTCMIGFKYGNLVTVNDSYGPTYLIWNVGTLQRSMILMVPIPYMECGNLVTINAWWCPIHYVECGNFVTINGLWSPWTPYGMWGPCNGILHMYDLIWMWEPCNCQWLLWSHIPYMECGNPATVNNSYGPPYLIWNVGTL